MGPITVFCCGMQPRRRCLQRPRLHGDALFRASPSTPRRKAGLGDGDRRSRTRLQRDDGADCSRWGKILIGTNGGEYGIRGFVKTYDAKTEPSFSTTSENLQRLGHHRRAGSRHDRTIAAEKAALASIGDPYKTLGGGVRQDPAVDLETNRIYFLFADSPTGPQRTTSIPIRSSRWTCTPGKYAISRLYIVHDVWDSRRGEPRRSSPTSRTRRPRSSRACCTPTRTARLRPRRQDCSLIRFSEAMVPQENMWVLPTKEGARMLPGAKCGVEWSPMASTPAVRLSYAVNLHQPMTYHVGQVRRIPPANSGSAAPSRCPTEEQWGNITRGRLQHRQDGQV